MCVCEEHCYWKSTTYPLRPLSWSLTVDWLSASSVKDCRRNNILHCRMSAVCTNSTFSFFLKHPNLCLMYSSQLSSSNLVCIHGSDFGSSVILLMLWLLKCDYWPYRGLSGQYPLKSLNSAEEREEIWPLVNYLQPDVCVPLVWRVEQPESAADTRTMFDRGPIEFSLMSSEERITFLCHLYWWWYDILVVFVTVVILTLIESPEKKSPLLMSGAIIIILLWNTRLKQQWLIFFGHLGASCKQNTDLIKLFWSTSKHLPMKHQADTK